VGCVGGLWRQLGARFRNQAVKRWQGWLSHGVTAVWPAVVASAWRAQLGAGRRLCGSGTWRSSHARTMNKAVERGGWRRVPRIPQRRVRSAFGRKTEEMAEVGDDSWPPPISGRKENDGFPFVVTRGKIRRAALGRPARPRTRVGKAKPVALG
jgi:hypothetical protein